jgi:hypothetical protein
MMANKKFGPGKGKTLSKLIDEHLRDEKIRRDLFLTELRAYGITSADLSVALKGIPVPVTNKIANDLRDIEIGFKK